VLFQLVPEIKKVKNRLHLDVRTGTHDVQRTVAEQPHGRICPKKLQRL
jgi:hypothetical protein